MQRGVSGMTGQLHSGNDALSTPSGQRKASGLAGGKSGFDLGSDLSAGYQGYGFGTISIQNIQDGAELKKLRRSHAVSSAEGCS